MTALDNFKEDGKFKDRICDALLLQFKEPKVRDLTIPDEYNVYSLVVIAGKILDGQKVNPKEVNCGSTGHDYSFLEKEYFSKLLPKVSNGLFSILKIESKGEKSHLYYYLGNDYIFGCEWFFGAGDWYRFRDGQRGKAEQRVEDYFSKKEIGDFNEVGRIIQPYIGLTNSACKIKN